MRRKYNRKEKPILAIASGGGHWIQLLSIKKAWESQNVVYATVDKNYKEHLDNEDLFIIPDANIRDKKGTIKLLICVLLLVLRIRPKIVISTGAAPGFFGIVFGKLIGAKTIWLDSIANGEEMSLSGKKARFFADIWLTQWPHLSTQKGPFFEGSVI